MRWQANIIPVLATNSMGACRFARALNDVRRIQEFATDGSTRSGYCPRSKYIWRMRIQRTSLSAKPIRDILISDIGFRCHHAENLLAKHGSGNKHFPMRESVDVLILHGKSTYLVSYLKELLESLGVSANTALGLPSQRKNQEQRIDHYIKNSKMCLVLLTFDEDEPASNKARPNVYDEIARCRKSKKDDTVILQERREKELVDLPSNVRGQVVVIEFEREKLYAMLPNLITEIRSRDLPSVGTHAERKSEAAHILNRFLDQMDDLWESQFDDAWDNVHRKDYKAERNFAIKLDLFFQQYQNVFSALIREKKTGDELVAACNAAYAESHKLAAEAWEIVTEAKFQEVDNANSSPAEHPRVKNALDTAATTLKNGKRMPSAEARIQAFRSAFKLLQRA
jgi:hypothetical protein